MGAWAKDPVPGAAAGAVHGCPGCCFMVARGGVGSWAGVSPRGGARHRVFRPCAHGPWPLVVYYYIITPLSYIIILFYVNRTSFYKIGPREGATATAEEFSDRVRPLSHHAQGLNIAFGFPSLR